MFGISRRIIKVTKGNLLNSHLYVAGNYDFFPADCIGPSNRRQPNGSNSVPITIRFEGLNQSVSTDIARDSCTGRPRREFRDRQTIRRFFQYHQIQAGDELAIERLSERAYVLYPYNTAYQRRVSTSFEITFPESTGRTAIELFVGAGGLAIGTQNAGFDHTAVLDWDVNACETLRRNQSLGMRAIRDWSIIEGDVRHYNFRQHEGKVDFVFGGPPCQPFSLGGKHLGHEDERNMFPEAVRAIREIRPRAFIFENVKGLLRKGFANYYSYIIHQFEFPEVIPKGDQDWVSHHAELERLHTSGIHSGLRYNVVYQLLNAADFGVPQRRERVFVVGIRSDLGLEFSFPEPTHTEDGLLYEKWVSGSYWDRHRVPLRKRPLQPERLKNRINNLSALMPEMLGCSWQTVRDATHDLPKIGIGKKSSKIPNHYLNPGARSYAGHNGSFLDEPAKTLKAGDHGVPGGENTLRLHDRSLRYFSVRECARLQTFPDEWVFQGSWTESMRQLGNAVPVKLGAAVAAQLARVLSKADVTMVTC